MQKTIDHSAIPSALGYYHQSMYALLVLLDAEDDEVVSVETRDDVVKEGNGQTLMQLKSSVSRPKSISEKSSALWNTFDIWISSPDFATSEFVLVTAASIKRRSPLIALCDRNSDRQSLCDTLVAEARRILGVRKQQRKAGERLSYRKHAKGCRLFLSLRKSRRVSFLDRISFQAGSFPTSEFPAEIAKRMQNILHRALRDQLAERLMEWWDRRIARGFLKEMPRTVSKLELQQQIQTFLQALQPDSLPDGFSRRRPDSLASELGGIMEQQIRLVAGGDNRIQRAALARWRARNQRNQWLDADLAAAAELIEYDDHLIEQWSDLFGPMCDDMKASASQEKITHGLALLDWSHVHAPRAVRPLRLNWNHEFLVQGIYQELSDQCRVGWHPNYVSLLQNGEPGAVD